MKQTFIACQSQTGHPTEAEAFAPVAKSRKEAEALVPWAAIVAACEGGWQAFESWTDYETWKQRQ